jgi:hypothetical protein
MWFRRAHADQLAIITAVAIRVEAAAARIEDALSLDTPGGLAAVRSEAKDARTAGESAFVGVQALASQATVKPGLPELTKAVSAQVDALRAMERTVRTATGPQPALTTGRAPADAAGPAPAKPAGMGSRAPKTSGKP